LECFTIGAFFMPKNPYIRLFRAKVFKVNPCYIRNYGKRWPVNENNLRVGKKLPKLSFFRYHPLTFPYVFHYNLSHIRFKETFMGNQVTFTFNLPSPQYRRFLDFIAEDEKSTPGKVLCKFIHEYVWDVVDKRASEKAHKELVTESSDKLFVSWVRGSNMNHWQRLANTIGADKAMIYQVRFLPLWEKYVREIDDAAGLNYSNLDHHILEVAEMDFALPLPS